MVSDILAGDGETITFSENILLPRHPREETTMYLNLRICDNFFSNRVVEAWSMIPGVIKRLKTVSSFKNVYRRHRKNMVENA